MWLSELGSLHMRLAPQTNTNRNMITTIVFAADKRKQWRLIASSASLVGKRKDTCRTVATPPIWDIIRLLNCWTKYHIKGPNFNKAANSTPIIVMVMARFVILERLGLFWYLRFLSRTCTCSFKPLQQYGSSPLTKYRLPAFDRRITILWPMYSYAAIIFFWVTLHVSYPCLVTSTRSSPGVDDKYWKPQTKLNKKQRICQKQPN